MVLGKLVAGAQAGERLGRVSAGQDNEMYLLTVDVELCILFRRL